MSERKREHDVVVFGATGFVGELVAERLVRHAPASTRIALAGRSREKLASVRERLPGRAQDWPLVVADSTEPASLAAMAASTRVVVSTVGPYLRYGMPLVEACARAGTHYADLTGEAPFVRMAADAFDDVARASGARLVHACGYDSVPSDLAVLTLHRRVTEDGAGSLADVLTVASAKGGLSGGTIASALEIADHAARDRSVRRVLADPYSLSPDRDAEPVVPQPPDAVPPGRLTDGRWTAPFPMASINGRVVRRSNALQRWAYGSTLRYAEAASTGRGVAGAARALGLTVGLGVGSAVMGAPWARGLLDRVLPAPGTGPDEEARRTGWFRMDVRAVTTTGRQYRALASGQGDPGYAATAVMLSEAALALAHDGDLLPDRAGSLTPAAGIGDVLVDRLRAAGHTYEAAPR